MEIRGARVGDPALKCLPIPEEYWGTLMDGHAQHGSGCNAVRQPVFGSARNCPERLGLFPCLTHFPKRDELIDEPGPRPKCCQLILQCPRKICTR